ncbi:MAG: hypothetical protein ACOC6B_01340 [Thermodesulfobacteriota bacterium]
MATNFRIAADRNSKNLHWKLRGDFDGTSAFELLEAIRSHSHHPSKIFIHTDGLRAVEPFGLDVFHSHFDLLKGENIELVFIGKNAAALAPNPSPLFGFSISIKPEVDTQGMAAKFCLQ